MGDPVTTAGFGGGSPPGTSQPLSGLLSPAVLPRQPLPKQLTAAIKSCTSLERLVQLFQAYQTVLNPIHVAAIITKLPKLDITQATSMAGSNVGWMLPSATVQQLQLTQLLQQLLGSLKLQGCNDHSPRGVANILWALAKLQCAPDAELRAMLLDRFCAQLSSAVPQDISNVLWGVAKLTKEHAAVRSTSLQQGSAVLNLQEHSSGGQPAASPGPTVTVSAAAPLLQQQQVQLLLQHLCQQLHNMSVQTISNSLWAVVVLQQEHQWCMCGCQPQIQTLLSMFCQHLQQAMPGHVQPIVRCMAQLATACSSHAGDSWLHWQPPLLQRLLDYLSGQREQLEMRHVSSVLRDVAQIMCLRMQHSKQLQDKQQARRSEPFSSATAYSSASSLPSVCVAGVSHSSSTASSSSMLGSSPVVAAAAASNAPMSGGEDAEEVLTRLAAAGGPQDASSTVLALAMLRSQLQQLGLQPGVASLCSLLPPAALPHLGPEVGPRLLAAATYRDLPSACSPTAAVMPGQLGGTEDCAGAAVLPVSSMLAARIFASSREGLPVVPVPLAVPGSLSSSTSGSSMASPTEPSPIAASCATTSPTAAGVVQAQLPHSDATGLELSSSTAMSAAALAGLSGYGNPGHSNPGHSNPGHSNPGHKSHAQGGVPGSSHNPGGTAAAPEGGPPSGTMLAGAAAGTTVPAGGNAGAVGDTQEEAAARQLTHNIAYADSVFQLADIFTAHASVMDMIHITACITRLSKVLGTSPSQASQAAAASLLPLLGNKLLAVLPNANARGIANVLWGYGRLRSLPQLQLLAPLVDAFLKQLPNAACRDSAVVLWSLARLSEGHGEPAEVTLQPALLRRLGREVLQQLAAAAQDSTAQVSGQPQRQQGTLGGSGMEQSRGGEGHERNEAAGPPSSRDVSNSLMALARLGFVPEDDTAAAPASRRGAGAPGAAPGATAQHSGQQRSEQSTSLAAQLQGLALASPVATPAAAEGSLALLTLPLSQIKAVVEYLLRMAATAKTLDLQETATALKQLGLRELHAKVAATVITQHGSAHGGAAGHGGLHGAQGVQYMHMGMGGRMGQLPGRHAGPQGHLPRGMATPGSQYAGMMQQQRRQQQHMPVSGPVYGQGWLPVQAPGGGQHEGGGMLRQVGAAGYMGTRPAASGQHQQQAYVLSVSVAGPVPAAGPRPGMSGLHTMGGVAPVAYGDSPGAGASPGTGGNALQYPGEQPQPPGLLQQQMASSVQYMLLPQQGVGGYAVQQPSPQQQQGEFLGMPVLQQQAPGEQAPPGLVAAGTGGQPQYYMQATSAATLVMPSNLGVVQDSGVGGGQQLFLQHFQQGHPASPGFSGLGQFGGAGVYQASAAMMMPQEYVPDTMTSSAYTASGAGDIFLGAQQPQQQGQRSQLQLLQRQVGQPVGMYQQQPQQQHQQQQQQGPGGFAAQDSGAVYLQQPQQQQQLPVLYGMPAQGQQQQLAAPQGPPGTFVLDPTSGVYVFQQ